MPVPPADLAGACRRAGVEFEPAERLILRSRATLFSIADAFNPFLVLAPDRSKEGLPGRQFAARLFCRGDAPASVNDQTSQQLRGININKEASQCGLFVRSGSGWRSSP
jgi:hypothetical protein